MKKNNTFTRRLKLGSIVSLAILASTMMMQTTHAANTTIQFQINNWVITYGWPTALTFTAALNVSFGSQTINQDFTWAANYFWVQDMKGIDSWYNTTLQLSWNLVSSWNIISGSNVSFLAVWGITTLSWVANPRVVLDAATAWYQALNVSRNYIKRNNAANSWVIGYYGSLINLKVDVPAWQPAGAYTTVLVYTLIEN